MALKIATKNNITPIQRGKIKNVLTQMLRQGNNKLSVTTPVDTDCIHNKNVSITFYWKFTELKPVLDEVIGAKGGKNVWQKELLINPPELKYINQSGIKSMLEGLADYKDLASIKGVKFLGSKTNFTAKK